jgi:hypothetical protein
LGFFGADDTADSGVAKDQSKGTGPKPLPLGDKLLVGGPSQEGETGSVEKKAKNHQGKPTNHEPQGTETAFSCKTSDRTRIDPRSKKRDSVSS